MNIDLKGIWEQIKKNVEVPSNMIHSFELLVENCYIKEIDNGKLILVVDSPFNKIVLESEFFIQISNAINITLNSNFELNIWSKDEQGDGDKKANAENSIINDSLNPNYSFENFVVSKENKTLFSASMSVAVAGGGMYNPLFIYGGSGLGKTHLLHAIGNQLWKKDPNKRIKYIEARGFSKIIHEAQMEENIYEGFSKIQIEFEKYDMLLIDDIQYISDQKKTKEIFFNIFNYFYNKQKQVVITSDQYVSEMGGFEERFITRFKSGLILTVIPPDVETAKKIILRKLEKQNSILLKIITDESLEYIAMNFSSNVRSLEGAINRILIETIQFGEKTITLEVCNEIFKDISKNNRGLTPKKIITCVSKYFDVNYNAIVGKSRRQDIMNARHFSIYLIKNLTNLSLKEIGKEFDRDHSTILSSINKVTNDVKKDTQHSKIIYELKKTILEK